MNRAIEDAMIVPTLIPGLSRPTASEFTLAPLPYTENALEPVISSRTLQVHYRKHHRSYVDTLNRLVAGTALADMSLKQLLLEVAGRPDQALIFNNAAQAWNHAFYWQSLSPDGGGIPPQNLRALIEYSFGDLAALKDQITAAALSQFGAGWVWLVLDGKSLRVLKTNNADNPLLQGLRPLVAIDVWEHAYYLDVENRRVEYVRGILDHLINWDFASDNLNVA
ncbi:MAG: superoxide dismutase [Steroidobacteraceae bacterium]|jgi:Fe-Mn family superoxide dismutase